MKSAAFAIAAVIAGAVAALPAAEAQRPAVDIRLVEGDPGAPYTVIGPVSGQAHQTSLFPKKSAREMVEEQLRDKASKMGADAVIQIKYDSYNPMTSKKGYRAAGQAVRFTATAATTPAPVPAPAPPPPVPVAAAPAYVAPAAPVVAAAPPPVVTPPAAATAVAPAVATAPAAKAGILLTEQNIARAYDVLGPVNVELNQASVSLDKTGRQVLDDALSAEAARLGADAVIMIRYAGAAGGKAPTALGVAVKFK